MPKPNLIRNVEEIADKISRKNIKESRAIIQLGTWVKNLVDELKAMKQRLDELDIRVKKINAYGATVLTRTEAAKEQRSSGSPEPKVKAGDLKRYRLLRKLSQSAMGALLGVTAKKYARWEAGKSIMVTPVEDKFREIQGIKGREEFYHPFCSDIDETQVETGLQIFLRARGVEALEEYITHIGGCHRVGNSGCPLPNIQVHIHTHKFQARITDFIGNHPDIGVDIGRHHE